MRHRTTLRSALAAHHFFDGVLDLALKPLHALMQTTLTVLGAQLFHLLGRNTQQLVKKGVTIDLAYPMTNFPLKVSPFVSQI